MQAIGEIRDFSKFNLISNRISAPKSIRPSIGLVPAQTSSKIRPSKFRSSSFEDNHPKSDFSFKLVTESELEAILKRVRRANQKKRDEEAWRNFLSSREQRNRDEQSREVVCESCSHSARNTYSCTEYEPEPASSSESPSPAYREDIKDGSGKLDAGDRNCKPSVEAIDNNDNSMSHTYQVGAGLSKRLQDLVATASRMSSVLLNPELHSQHEDEDVDRTIKRSLEFDAMFARNHLYEIQRLLKDTKQLATVKSPNTTDLETKISAALKSVTQALQVYTRHVGKGSRVKYQQVVPIFQSISAILHLVERLTGQRSFPFRQEIEVSCSYVKQVLLELSVTETQTVSTVSRKPVRVARARHKPSADLSMYRRRHKADWRRRTATHRPAVQPKEPVNVKEVPFRNATRAVPEEQVTTMMEIIPHEKSRTRCKSSNEENTRPTSSKSSSAREPRNVRLVCLREEAPIPQPQDVPATEATAVTLTVEPADHEQALNFCNKMAEYQQSKSHYKDGKALGIVDRMTNHILTEMIVDFQQDEMDRVIRTLYNLEFE